MVDTFGWPSGYLFPSRKGLVDIVFYVGPNARVLTWGAVIQSY